MACFQQPPVLHSANSFDTDIGNPNLSNLSLGDNELLMFPDLGGVLFFGVLGQLLFGSGCLFQMTVSVQCWPGNSQVCAFVNSGSGDGQRFALSLNAETGLRSVPISRQALRELFLSGDNDPTSSSSPDIFFRVEFVDAVCAKLPCRQRVTSLRSGLSLSLSVSGQLSEQPWTRSLRKAQLRAKKLRAQLMKPGQGSRVVKGLGKKLKRVCAHDPASYVQATRPDAPPSILEIVPLGSEYLLNEVCPRQCPPRPFSVCTCKSFRPRLGRGLIVAYPVVSANTTTDSGN